MRQIPGDHLPQHLQGCARVTPLLPQRSPSQLLCHDWAFCADPAMQRRGRSRSERLRLLAQELGTTPNDALRQLAAHGRQGWPWLLGLDLRHQRRTVLMQTVRPKGNRVGFKLPERRDGA